MPALLFILDNVMSPKGRYLEFPLLVIDENTPFPREVRSCQVPIGS